MGTVGTAEKRLRAAGTVLVTQTELATLADGSARLAALRAELKRLDAAHDAHEAHVLAKLLTRGHRIEPGRFDAAVEVDVTRRVSWKAVCEDLMGELRVKAILDATEPTRTPRVVVSAAAPPPCDCGGDDAPSSFDFDDDGRSRRTAGAS